MVFSSNRRCSADHQPCGSFRADIQAVSKRNYLDGVQLWSGTDTNTLTTGTVAMYSWMNTGAQFDNVLVRNLSVPFSSTSEPRRGLDRLRKSTRCSRPKIPGQGPRHRAPRRGPRWSLHSRVISVNSAKEQFDELPQTVQCSRRPARAVVRAAKACVPIDSASRAMTALNSLRSSSNCSFAELTLITRECNDQRGPLGRARWDGPRPGIFGREHRCALSQSVEPATRLTRGTERHAEIAHQHVVELRSGVHPRVHRHRASGQRVRVGAAPQLNAIEVISLGAGLNVRSETCGNG